MQAKYKVVITGSSGFLGLALQKELLDPGSPLKAREVILFDKKPGSAPLSPEMTFVQGDVRDASALQKCFEGADLVIHAAAIVDWGAYSAGHIHAVNVEGTSCVIDACKRMQVKALVYTSSLDVLHDGSPLVGVDEDKPYPEKHSTDYCRSKYLAEKLVLSANSPSLRTCSLRPADIYGEGDPYHIGSLIQMAKKGFYIRLGDGKSRCQHLYVRNGAFAHLLAGSALLEGKREVEGQAYFLTDGPPSNFFTFFDPIIREAGYRMRPSNLWLPRSIAYGIGSMSEWIAFLWRPIKHYQPKMSRFAVVYTCTDYTFTAEKAARDFGFHPKYSKEEAFHNSVEYFHSEKEEENKIQPR